MNADIARRIFFDCIRSYRSVDGRFEGTSHNISSYPWRDRAALFRYVHTLNRTLVTRQCVCGGVIYRIRKLNLQIGFRRFAVHRAFATSQSRSGKQSVHAMSTRRSCTRSGRETTEPPLSTTKRSRVFFSGVLESRRGISVVVGLPVNYPEMPRSCLRWLIVATNVPERNPFYNYRFGYSGDSLCTVRACFTFRDERNIICQPEF